MSALASTRRRGGPLIVLGVLLSAWIAGRAAMWENPFPLNELQLPEAVSLLAQSRATDDTQSFPGASPPMTQSDHASFRFENLAQFGAFDPDRIAAPSRLNAEPDADGLYHPSIAVGHILLAAAAFRMDGNRRVSGSLVGQPLRNRVVSPIAPPTLARALAVDRWSLDAFAFYRAGSNSTAISQGRVPVYGASQAGANLQYRINPGASRDPRAFLRAYHAFVPDGENEVAAGISARPFGAIPVRVFAELRVTDNVFGTQLRPAAYAVTELAPARLPFDFRLEAYGGAGYVGGTADTAFVDGQLTVTRELARFDRSESDEIRVSLGAGAWGGAQEDANRVDVGPTMRVDLNVGEIPARISLDWRERVAGDASPTSGFAATLSTRF